MDGMRRVIVLVLFGVLILHPDAPCQVAHSTSPRGFLAVEGPGHSYSSPGPRGVGAQLLRSCALWVGRLDHPDEEAERCRPSDPECIRGHLGLEREAVRPSRWAALERR